MHFLADFFFHIFGKALIESLGAFVRKTWYKATGTKPYNPKCSTKQWGFENLIDMESYKNRMAGLIVFVPIAIFVVYLSYQ